MVYENCHKKLSLSPGVTAAEVGWRAGETISGQLLKPTSAMTPRPRRPSLSSFPRTVNALNTWCGLEERGHGFRRQNRALVNKQE